MSRIIPGEELDSCHAWHVPEVQAARKTDVPMTARQLEQLHSQAREDGYRQGVEEGRQAGLNELKERVQLMDQLLGSLSRPFEELDDAVENQTARLAMMVARQLVRRELKADPQEVVGVVREALAALPLAAREIRVALNPDDVSLVRAALSLHDSVQNIQIVDDPVQSRGGCRVITESSQIDATVESRLNAVIAGVLGGSRGSDMAES